MDEHIYLIGIGGIGMSALARHFQQQNLKVTGYDRTPSRLTDELKEEGIEIIFEDDPELIPIEFRNPKTTRVIYTPAIPEDNKILKCFREKNFEVEKRAYALGQLLTDDFETIAVAGTHGKTTTSTLVAHILRSSHVGCSAILGGISSNYETNYWHDSGSVYMVTEADEYDRSFHQLYPHIALISAMDADHLDIYGTREEMRKAFIEFGQKVVDDGTLIYNIKTDFPIDKLDESVETFSYSGDNRKADFHAEDIRLDGRKSHFTLVSPWGKFLDMTLSLPGEHNVENAVGAIALAMVAGAEEEEIRLALATFRGNRRRFDYHIESEGLCLIDDYAHHPEELRAMIRSLRKIYPDRELTVVFQPHLYTRTRDLRDGFSEVLSLADHVILLPIYPARELPIEGVTSEMLMKGIKCDCKISSREDLANDVLSEKREIVLMAGAGDIETMVAGVEKALKEAYGL